MGRSVVNKGTTRCEKCEQSPRWCICTALSQSPSGVDLSILIHHAEFYKPTSTGKLIHRIDPTSRLVMYKHDLPVDNEALSSLGKKTYILHPFGEPLSESLDISTSHFILLDGSWKQAAQLLRIVEDKGQKVSLPMTGPSFFWLRAKQEGSRYSTIESAIFLLRHLGKSKVADEWQKMLHIHVYAGLLARGRKDQADSYAAEVFTVLPDIISLLREGAKTKPVASES